MDNHGRTIVAVGALLATALIGVFVGIAVERADAPIAPPTYDRVYHCYVSDTHEVCVHPYTSYTEALEEAIGSNRRPVAAGLNGDAWVEVHGDVTTEDAYQMIWSAQ